MTLMCGELEKQTKLTRAVGMDAKEQWSALGLWLRPAISAIQESEVD